MRFKIDWASIIVRSKFTVFALFYFVFEGNFQVQAPGGLYLEGRFNGGFFVLRVWGAYTYEEAYFWNFTVLFQPDWQQLNYSIVNVSGSRDVQNEVDSMGIQNGYTTCLKM